MDIDIQRSETLEVLPPEGDGRNLALAGTNCHLGKMVGAKGLSEALPKVLDPTRRVAPSPLAGLLRQTFFSGYSSFRVETPLAGPIFSEGTTFLQRKDGRGERIRTFDLLVPNQALYQAKLRPEK